MRSIPRSKLALFVVVAAALATSCSAQEVGFVDLTKITPRRDLRRPPASSRNVSGYHGIESSTPCSRSAKTVGALQASLLSLDRVLYQIGEKPTFEVKVENVGSTDISIPFSPPVADLQPEDAAKKFSYLELTITLWIASGDRWSSNSGGGVSLYGASDHAETMVTLRPGEWVRVVGQGRVTLGEGGPVTFAEDIRPTTADHIYAEASLYRKETLITPTQSATSGREVCLDHKHGQSVPIQLIMP